MDLVNFVEEVRRTLDAQTPDILSDDSPAPRPGAFAEQNIYFVGLIGGKDVGKSSIVNALVGGEISPQTSHGPGTEQVIAYAHESVRNDVERHLDMLVPGQYRVVTHDKDSSRRQVLLDLPDIDSHYSSHIELTRRMLRHMLFPLWVQSVEKYADHRPRELLAQVAQGNSPQNFLFCLNKVDQVYSRGPKADAGEVRDDFARRLATQLGLPSPPRVWMISAHDPGAHDLPELRRLLSDARPQSEIDRSAALAEERQGQTLLQWVQRQELPGRAAALARLEDAAREEVANRVATPLLDTVIPGIYNDAAYRLALADQALERRIAKWPLVNIVHGLMGPLLSLLRRRLPIEQQFGLAGTARLAEQHVRDAGSSQMRGVGAILQTAFARLQQLSPMISGFYRDRKLWESMPASSAEADLVHRFAMTIERQREFAERRLGPGGGLWPVVRWLLTVGAVLWFPFLQPLLEAMLQGGAGKSIREIALLGVQILGTTYLLKNIGFLLLYFFLLWLAIKWHTQRQADRWIERARASSDPGYSLPHQVIEWTDDLLAPISTAARRMKDLADQAERLRRSIAA